MPLLKRPLTKSQLAIVGLEPLAALKIALFLDTVIFLVFG
jgi:hypothetical protein